MTTQNQSSLFYNSCTANITGNHLHIRGYYDIQTDIPSTSEELDQLIELSRHIGQQISLNVAATTLECADQRAAELAQQAAGHLHKNGKRPFTLIAPYGRLKIKRQRLRDPKTDKTIIPSAILWKTTQNRHIVSALAQSACEESQQVSFRKSKENLSKTANVDSLLAHATIWKLKQKEGRCSEKAQDQLVEKVLSEHRATLDQHGFLPPPSNDAGDEDSTEVFAEEKEMEEIEEQADELYTHFTSEHRKNKSESVVEESKANVATPSDVKGKRVPRHVPADTILMQADEVVTKSQEPGRKQNKTHTVTIETGWGRIEYLAARSSEKLQLLVAAILVLFGLFSGKKLKLEVISDGAAWIRLWVARLVGINVYCLLCWYHLCKRVCAGLSGLGTSAEERKLLQKEILGHLWKGDVDGAVAVLEALLPRCRVKSRVQELIDYLIRKRSWIGDYEGRHAAGLWIASTRVEKWNDTSVSERCKGRGMSWKETGVLAMALHAASRKRNAAKNAKTEPEKHTSL